MGGNRAFGDFLKARRHALDPEALGLTGGRRRRTRGLRREEVAERAGISCEWYIKLEQGRDVSPSSQTVRALASALALNPTETAHLRRLADRPTVAFRRKTVPVFVAAIVEGLPDPAYVTGARGDVLTWNAAAEKLFGFSRMAEGDRNILLFMLTSPAARALFANDWASQASRMVALFRVAYDLYTGDPAFEDLVSRLSAASGEFAGWWSSHEIRLPSAGEKTLYSTDRSNLRYVFASFQCNDEPELKLVLYKPVDDRA